MAKRQWTPVQTVRKTQPIMPAGSAMSSKVFGIGWAKTGTTTLGSCLRTLGYRHTSQRMDLVSAYASGNLTPILDAAREADSFDDWPWILLFRQLDSAFPGSRFILTVRDPERWLRSYANMLRRSWPPSEQITVARRTIYGLPFPDVTEDALVRRYILHNREVTEFFAGRPDSLLIVDWEQGHGWGELCGFLKRSIPAQHFPHENRGLY
jgi:hypothetical protein